jgi:aryl-alcohol dehydrogenase-like predicted oxidoreductase
MNYGRVNGLVSPVSRLVLGSMPVDINALPDSYALLDFFFEHGGNCIDTAWLYRRGDSEKCVGAWIENRGIRSKIVIIGKGAAPVERCTPAVITSQLEESLERLRTDYVDIYLMHRDNPEIPVEAFVDCLNEHYRSGRIRSFGGSNWTTRRIEEANAYARAHGLVGFTASSPNLSLAVWNEPMWADCISASDKASREWYRRSEMALFAWSSQASGFFSGRYNGNSADTPFAKEVARVWFNAANFERLERARSFARSRGVTPGQIALAYVLCESLSTFALIGPQTSEELRESIEALPLVLSDSERQWLNLES